MLITTEAIVLNLQRHNDRSHILHAYTSACGRVNYLVYGAGSKKKSAALYAPLSRIEITADMRPDRPVPTLKDARLLHTAIDSDAHTAQVKAAIRMFLAEMLYRILKHPMPDEQMFRFIDASLHQLDQTDRPQDFHADFLAGFAARLGFAIDETEHPELVRVPLNRADRQLLLRQLCDYYALHLEDFQYPLSLDVLTEVFD